MDTGLLQDQGSINLGLGEVLRLRNPAGRHIGVVRGVAWVTQDGDLQDRALGAGESFRFNRDGLAIVMPLGVPTKLVLEEGLVPERKVKARNLSLDAEALAHFDRRARRLRAEAVAQMFAGVAGALKRLWVRARTPAAALQERQTAQELRGLSDHILRDVGLRRDQIDCVARQVPC